MLTIIGFLALALSVACAGGERTAEPTTSTVGETTTTETTVSGPVPAGMLEEMKADLTERTGLSADEIEVVRAEAVTWRDGSLGCPEPGMMYTQALVEGFLVILEADGEEHRYHAAQAGHFVHCPEDRAEEPLES